MNTESVELLDIAPEDTEDTDNELQECDNLENGEYDYEVPEWLQPEYE